MIWVAEVGSAHKGMPSLAYEFIRVFSEAGADVLKFQFGWTKEAQEQYGLVYNPVRFVDSMASDLKKWCDYFGVELMASIWSEMGLETARLVGMKQYKIAYRMKDEELIDAIYSDGKPVFHTGKNVFAVSEYPTYPDMLHMPSHMSMNYNGYIGYSDHTHGIEACLLAVVRGAQYIEKHVALDKSDLVTKDTPFSAIPEEFADMVKIGNRLRRLLDAEETSII